MVELFCRFPIRKIVTSLAFVSELALVRVLVAGDTVLCQSKERFGDILHFDERALIANHIARHVTLFAGNAGMFAFQLVPRQFMIELLLRRLPVDQAKILSVVLQMASHTVFAVRVSHL